MNIKVLAFKTRSERTPPKYLMDVFNAFAKGCGGKVIRPPFAYDPNVDLYVSLGTNGPNINHNPKRKELYNIRAKSWADGKNVVCIDASLMDRNFGTDPNKYYRVSYNHIINKLGIYFDYNRDYPQDRWDKLNLELKPWRKSGDHIVLVMQAMGDPSHNGVDHYQWVKDTLAEIPKYTDRKIILKIHPRYVKDPNHIRYTSIKPWLDKLYKNNIEIDFLGRKSNCLDNCHAAISFTSNMSQECIIAGIPNITDTEWNFTHSISSPLKDIENPKMVDRQPLLNKLSYGQWNKDEMASGECWIHLKELV